MECQEPGEQLGRRRSWILPRDLWEEGLWPGIRTGSDNPLTAYLEKNKVQKHGGVHNLKSSWVLCANMYFPLWRVLRRPCPIRLVPEGACLMRRSIR